MSDPFEVLEEYVGEVVGWANENNSEDQVKAEAALATLREQVERYEALRQAADPELALVPSDQEMYRVFTEGTEAERINLSTSLRVLVGRIRALAADTPEDE